MFDTVCIINSNTPNNISTTQYIVCKQFNLSYINTSSLVSQLLHHKSILFGQYFNNNVNITSILFKHPPSYFIDKLEDYNIITGKIQLNYLDRKSQTVPLPNPNTSTITT